jgi:hypothetical protein
MKDYREIVNVLSGAKGKLPSENKVRRILTDCFQSIGILTHTLHPGYLVARVRPNNGSELFTHTSELSYRPITIEGNPQRANTKHTSRFYGASCERRCPDPITDVEYGINVALFETLDELRDNCNHSFGSYPPSCEFPPFYISLFTAVSSVRVTYSIWEVSEYINLASVAPQRIHDNDWVTHHLRTHIMNSHVIADPYSRLTEHFFWEFLTAKFTNLGAIDSEQPDYLISGVAAELLTDMGFDGVSYPSTRCRGIGINIAVRPEIADTRLQCTKVGLLNVKTDERKLIIEHEHTINLTSETNSFVFKPASTLSQNAKKKKA